MKKYLFILFASITIFISCYSSKTISKHSKFEEIKILIPNPDSIENNSLAIIYKNGDYKILYYKYDLIKLLESLELDLKNIFIVEAIKRIRESKDEIDLTNYSDSASKQYDILNQLNNWKLFHSLYPNYIELVRICNIFHGFSIDELTEGRGFVYNSKKKIFYDKIKLENYCIFNEPLGSSIGRRIYINDDLIIEIVDVMT
jgi:hypothetical protein